VKKCLPSPFGRGQGEGLAEQHVNELFFLIRGDSSERKDDGSFLSSRWTLTPTLSQSERKLDLMLRNDRSRSTKQHRFSIARRDDWGAGVATWCPSRARPTLR